MNTKGLLKDTLKIFLKNFKYIVIVCLFAYIPFNIAILFVKFPDINLAAGIKDYDLNAYRTFVLTTLALRSVFLTLVSAAYTYIAEQSNNGKEINLPGILDVSLMKWFKLVFTSITCLVIYSLTSFLIILPIYFAIYFMFCSNIVASTDLWGFNALKKSMSMVRRKWWRMFAFEVVLLSILFLMTFVNMFALWGIVDIIGPAFSSVPLMGLAAEIFVKSLLDSFVSFPQLAIAVCFCRRKLEIQGG